jgi:protein-S-isoprenylcysteine O-methyltransferase Ste14
VKSLFLRNLFFTILQPGMVAGLVPYLLAREKWVTAFDVITLRTTGGIFLFLAGFLIMIYCIVRFATEGKGTLSPADPTRKLVVSGLYKFSRNPMYIGVMLMLIGEAVTTGSQTLWIYALIIFICFHAFILLHEEPRLKKVFGESYEAYRKEVRRWI